MTWQDLFSLLTGGVQALAAQEPALVAQTITPGTNVEFTVDSELGAIPVLVTVPAPLAPPTGSQVRVRFRDTPIVTVDVPAPPL